MEKKKSNFSNFFICIFSIILALLMLIGILTGMIGKNNFHSWKKQFTKIVLPEDCIVLQSNSKRGLVNTAYEDNVDYGIYWIIETGETEQELEALYLPYVEKANTDVIGKKNILIVTSISDPIPLNMDDLEKYIKEEFLPEEHDQNIFIVSILKPGRKLFYN